MKIEIAEHGRMSESGSSLLRLIQNQDIPLLDLLVRESVQNSLDARKENAPNVEVDISVGEFKSRNLTGHLEKIESGLNSRYSSLTCKYIAIRDTNTQGLTGPVRYSEVKNNVFGNLLKLVYEICKPQQNEGAGGSWGLGKTIYFRLGIGLVLYYSRIYQNGRFQSRLAACLVEDETKSGALIPGSGVRRGIAWWGKRDGVTGSNTIPIDNEKEISKILDIFGIPPYVNSETGTTVIIPYINEENLLNEVYAKNEPTEHKPYWAGSVQEYLKVAIQRWYAPRLLNSSYPYGPYLVAKVNGERIKVSQMLSTFRLIRELHILSTDGSLDDESLIVSKKIDYQVESIDLRGVLNTTSSGKLVYAKLTREQMLMEPPHNEKAPYQQISNIYLQAENGNVPIIMFTRQPGMIVGYDYDGQWTHRMPKSNPDEYIIGLFVANSRNTLKNITDFRTGDPMTLEEYIRQGEKADHASWTDRNIAGNNPRIISSIQKNVINKIKKKFTDAPTENIQKQNIGLGHALADMLLPSEDFGGAATPPRVPGNNDNPGHRPGKKSAFRIDGLPQYENGQTSMNFDLVLKGKTCLIALQVVTDFKRFDADLWENADEIGKPFPLQIKQMDISTAYSLPKLKNSSYQCNCSIDSQNSEVSHELFEISLEPSSAFGTAGYVRISPKKQNLQLKGKITFTFSDYNVRGGLEMKEIET